MFVRTMLHLRRSYQIVKRPPKVSSNSRVVLWLNHLQAGDYLKVADVQCGQGIAQMKRCCANQQILECDANTGSSLLSFDSACEFSNFNRHRMYYHIAAQFIAKCL